MQSRLRPQYRARADFFRALAHPARIRILELVGERQCTVAELIREVEIKAASMSQQLSVLRRAGLVATHKAGDATHYALVDPSIAQVLAAAQRALAGVLSGQVELLADLHRG